jgi:hypothetical protein
LFNIWAKLIYEKRSEFWGGQLLLQVDGLLQSLQFLAKKFWFPVDFYDGCNPGLLLLGNSFNLPVLSVQRLYIILQIKLEIVKIVMHLKNELPVLEIIQKSSLVQRHQLDIRNKSKRGQKIG